MHAIYGNSQQDSLVTSSKTHLQKLMHLPNVCTNKKNLMLRGNMQEWSEKPELELKAPGLSHQYSVADDWTIISLNKY